MSCKRLFAAVLAAAMMLLPTLALAEGSLTLSEQSITMTLGEGTHYITSTLSGSDDTRRWQSSDTSVVTLATAGGGRSAYLTAVGEGEAVITVTAGELSASCRVTVTAAATGVTSTVAAADENSTETDAEQDETQAETGGAAETTDATQSTAEATETQTETAAETFVISVEYTAGGSVSGPDSVEKGERAEYTITADTGWHIAAVTVDGVSVGAAEEYAFSSVTKNHTLTAVFEQHILAHYFAAEPTTEATGNLEYWYCTTCGKYFSNSAGTKETTLSAVTLSKLSAASAAAVAETVEAEPSTEDDYSDLTAGAWYASAVEFVLTNGLMNGVGGGEFDPDGVMSRAMLVTVLHRAAGYPEATAASAFADTERDSWYSAAVDWAAQNGIVKGYSTFEFDPNGSVTREQIAAIFQRYAAWLGVEEPESGDISGFSDAAQISSWAEDSIRWAVGSGLLHGNADGTLNPSSAATRAETAQILLNFELSRG